MAERSELTRSTGAEGTPGGGGRGGSQLRPLLQRVSMTSSKRLHILFLWDQHLHPPGTRWLTANTPVSTPAGLQLKKAFRKTLHMRDRMED